jgi:carboxynorspermidine decarboxylase
MWSTFPLIKKYLHGATASSLNEALLCYEEMGSKPHTYAPAYIPDEFEKIAALSSHITFNSITQFDKFKYIALKYGVSCGLRVNPGYSDVATEMYNPCIPGSRLGISRQTIGNSLPPFVEGLHFHALCESSAQSLEKVLASFEKNFYDFLPSLKWINMGGGHLITHKDYDTEHLIYLLKNFKSRYPNLRIILEPGAAIAWDTGILASTVLDIVHEQGKKILMLDVSFAAHMPDTLEMPYKPRIEGATNEDKTKPTYLLGGNTCLAGDYLPQYSFDKEIQIGDKIIFHDMMHYTMVKTTLFNGVKHPSILIWKTDNSILTVREFNYLDYKSRLS